MKKPLWGKMASCGCYLLAFLFAVAGSCGSASATGGSPVWEEAQGSWTRVLKGASGTASDCIVIDRSAPWDTQWSEMSYQVTIREYVPFCFFGSVLNYTSNDDHQLMRFYAHDGGTVIQMLNWKYGYYRMWTELQCPVLQLDRPYLISFVPAPPKDLEDWRDWKIVITDRLTGEVIFQQGIENEQAVFGFGAYGLYSNNEAVEFADFHVERPSTATLNRHLRLPAIFSDGMVLQHSAPNPIWGRAFPGAEVWVSTMRDYQTVHADEQGNWTATLPARNGNERDRIEVSSGGEAYAIEEVVYGEVWLVSGQSNMAMRVWETDVMDIFTDEHRNPDLRLFHQLQWPSEEPIGISGGVWERSTEENALGWSALSFSFARALQTALDMPVGIIGSYWGGTAIESWIEREELAKDEITRPILDRYYDALEKIENGEPVSGQFPWVWDSPGHRHSPGNLWNGMVYPHAPYNIRGIIWYQGESNSSKARQYGHLFPLLVDSWRESWGDERLPFYFVQLPGYDGRETGNEIPDAWPHMRDVQRRILGQRENMGMAVALHLGDSLNVHPPRKLLLGRRMADMALHDVYGQTDRPNSSPLPAGAEFSGGKAVIKFDHTYGGLATSDGRQPQTFVIAGADRVFYPAQAVINPDRESVTVWSDAVAEPVAVRYAWDNYVPAANLKNGAGLPASPFRTDDFWLLTDDDL